MRTLPADADTAKQERWQLYGIHEVGHGAISRVCGLPVHRLTLDYSPGLLGLGWSMKGRAHNIAWGTFRGAASHAAAVACAGMEAEAMWTSADTGCTVDAARAAAERDRGNRSDLNAMHDALADPDVTFTADELRWQVNGVLFDLWDGLVAAADALCRTGRLSGRELDTYL
ncbi:MAG TPA: hypothetical protein VGL02_27335 [Streptomyces sp.]